MTRSSLAQGRGTKHASHLRTTWMHPPPPCYMTRLLPTHQPFRMRLPFGGREASSMCSQVWSIGVSSDSKHTRMKRFEVSSCLRHGVNKMQATHVLTCLMSSHVSCPHMSHVLTCHLCLGYTTCERSCMSLIHASSTQAQCFLAALRVPDSQKGNLILNVSRARGARHLILNAGLAEG